MDYRQMTSPCGLDCFNCPLWLANEDASLRRKYADMLGIPLENACCPGCRNGKGVVSAIGRTTSCAIHACSAKRSIAFCHECGDFPCDLLHPRAFQADMRPHNTKVFNLCLIKKMGLERWAAEKAKSVRDDYVSGRIELDGEEG